MHERTTAWQASLLVLVLLLLPTCGSAMVRRSALPPERAGRELALRLQATSCEGLGVATGFAIDRATVLTNRHVVAQADGLVAQTFDGQHIRGRNLESDSRVDLGLVHLRVPTHTPIAHLARHDPISGDKVRAVGFPQGGGVKVADGRVIDYVDGTRYQQSSKVIVSSSEVEPGNSGGPLLDTRGQVVGIVFAIDLINNDSLALPVSAIRRELRRAGAFAPVRTEPCPPH